VAVSRCAAVYVELGERPELDQLQRCDSETAWAAEAGWLDRCAEHMTQLGWVRADPDRLAAYNAQLRRYDLGQRIGAQAEQAVLL
jgi:hypothetical protein